MSDDNYVSHEGFFYIIPAKLIEIAPNPYIPLLYGLIVSLTHKEGYCYASNKFLAERLNISERSIQNHLQWLEKSMFIKRSIDQSLGNSRKIYLNNIPIIQTKKEVIEDKNVKLTLCKGVKNFVTSEPQCVTSRTEVRDPSRTALRHSNISNSNIINNNSISSDSKNDSSHSTKIKRSQTEAKASASSHDIYYSKEEDKFRNITQHDLDDWKTIYPYVDFKKEIIKAKEWLKSNPSKARKKNWRKFLYNWFSSANETLERKAVYKSNAKSSGNNTEDSQKQELKKIWPMYQRYKNWYEKLQDIAKINIGYLVIEGNHYYNSKNPYNKNIVNAESIKNELLDIYRVPIQVLKG